MWNFLQSCSMWIFGKVPHGRWPPSPIPQNCPHLWKACACISYYLCNHISHEKTQFSENERGGRRPFEIFPKIRKFSRSHPSLLVVTNSSDLSRMSAHRLQLFWLVFAAKCSCIMFWSTGGSSLGNWIVIKSIKVGGQLGKLHLQVVDLFCSLPQLQLPWLHIWPLSDTRG